MFLIIFFTAFFEAFLLFPHLPIWDGKMGRNPFGLWFVLNLILGWAIYGLLVGFMHIRIVALLTGLVILVSGFRWLGIWNEDFFSLFKRLTFWDFGRISEPSAVYFSGLAAMAQLRASGISVNGFTLIALTNVLLAGFLLVLVYKREQLKNRQWLQALIQVEAGLYLAIMGLIIMGEDVPFFVTGFEKILHI